MVREGVQGSLGVAGGVAGGGEEGEVGGVIAGQGGRVPWPRGG